MFFQCLGVYSPFSKKGEEEKEEEARQGGVAQEEAKEPSGPAVLEFQCAGASPGGLTKCRLLAPLPDGDVIGLDGVKNLIVLLRKFTVVSNMNGLWHALWGKWPPSVLGQKVPVPSDGTDVGLHSETS